MLARIAVRRGDVLRPFLISVDLRLWAGPSADVPEVRSVDYGLFKRCEHRWVSAPPAGEKVRGILSFGQPPTATQVLIEFTLSEYRCTAFPARSTCEINGQFFCIAWNTAGYTSQFSLIFATGGLFTVTLANITTKKRRRNAWKIVSALVGVHGEYSDLSPSCSSPETPGCNRSAPDCYDGHNCEFASPFSSTPCTWDYL